MRSWDAVTEALDRAADAGRPVRFWLRDDDAVTVTPQLEILEALCASVAMPVLLAVIPAPAQPSLAAWLAGRPSITPCQHGFAHRNHAAAGARAVELGGRAADLVLEDLRAGRRRLQELFGARLADCLVPPWNRIDPAVIPLLPGEGYRTLSTFGPPPVPTDAMPRRNADLDIIDWRAGRIGRDLVDVCGKLAGLIAAPKRKGRPIGILTHHLVHDAQAWAVLETLLTGLRRHEGAIFTDVGCL